MNVHQHVQDYLGLEDREHGRERSWEHCYSFFQKAGPTGLPLVKDLSSLHLGFYLASWGMLRNSFLLDYTYTVHGGVIDLLADDRFNGLWAIDFGSEQHHEELIPRVADLIDELRDAYDPIVRTKKPTDTLVTKILIGTLGCFPAFDSYFLRGIGIEDSGLNCKSANLESIRQVFQFCQKNLAELQSVQAEISERRAVRYPLMKIIDMHFFQLGYGPKSL